MSFITIQIPQGKLKGKKNLTIYENEFYSFEGIPYAKPPIGDLRFKPPLSADPWEGEFDATIGTKVCPSYANLQAFPDLVDEDCLRLNVYTPVDLTNKGVSLLPVMVYIHGGGFIFGSSHRNDLGPDFLMSKKVVLVTINYRLGILGFFSLNNPEINVTGNAGLKDIIEALKWIQNNIINFGGDPKNITAFGNSAGGVLTNLLQLTPLSKGLFHKVILQSGSALIPGTFNLNRSSEIYNDYLKHIGCTEKQPSSILKYLQNKNYEELCFAEYEFFQNIKRHPQNFPTFVPSIEINHPMAFITENPEILLKNGQFFTCPTLIGFLEMDGTISTAFTPARPDTTDMSMFIPEQVLNSYSPEMVSKLLKLFEVFYYGNEIPSYANKNIFYKLTTDVSFLHAVRKHIQYSNKYSKYQTYYYKFMFKSKLNIKPGYLKHSDDERYIFSKPSTKHWVTKGSLEEEYVNIMTTLWANFAKSGNPNPIPSSSDGPNCKTIEWKPTSLEKINCLELNNIIKLLRDPGGDRIKFLETLFGLHSKI